MTTPLPSRLLAATVLLAGAACCPCTPGLRVGEVWIDGRDLDRQARSLAHSFPTYGLDTLRWNLLDHGLGAAVILHARHPEASRRAWLQAAAVAVRLRAGEDFSALKAEVEGAAATTPEAMAQELPKPPHPAGLGAAVAAAVARLEEGEWAGPLRTADGWELVLLERRFGPLRSRANVLLQRIRFPVGTPEDREQAARDWSILPLTGAPEYLDAVPAEVLRQRRGAGAPSR